MSWLPGCRRYTTILTGWRFEPFSGIWNNTSPPSMSAHSLPLWERWPWCLVSCDLESKRRRHSLFVHRYPNRTPLCGTLNIWIFCGQRSAGMSCACNKVKIRSKSIFAYEQQANGWFNWGYWAGLLQKLNEEHCEQVRHQVIEPNITCIITARNMFQILRFCSHRISSKNKPLSDCTINIQELHSSSPSWKGMRYEGKLSFRMLAWSFKIFGCVWPS